MADAIDPQAQHQVELDSGVVLTGVGGDIGAIESEIQDHHDERHPEPASTQAEKPTRGQRRFSVLTTERDEAKKRADAAEQKAKDLETRLAQFAQPQPTVQPASPPMPQVAPAHAAPAQRAKPTFESGQYKTYEDFIEDLADWKAEQRLAKVTPDLDARLDQRIEADRASRAWADHYAQFQARARSTYGDFDAVINTSQSPPLHPPILADILRLPGAEHVIYGLAKDKALAERVNSVRTPLELGFLVAPLIPQEGAAAPASTPPPVAASTAPAPIQPVEGRARTTSPPLEDLAKRGFDFDASGYRERRRAELKAAGRR